MKRKPEKGEALLLLSYTQKSRVGFSVPVECVGAFDREDCLMGKMPASKCPVTVMFPDGSTVEVTRADVESADAVRAERDND